VPLLHRQLSLSTFPHGRFCLHHLLRDGLQLLRALSPLLQLSVRSAHKTSALVHTHQNA
jgi:hypothetical protein